MSKKTADLLAQARLLPPEDLRDFVCEAKRLLAETEKSAVPEASPPSSYRTRTHDFQFKPGIDLSKLGQLDDDF